MNQQTVFVSVLPRILFSETVMTSPKVFATREAAQSDCDKLNKTRMSHNPQFEVIELQVNE